MYLYVNFVTNNNDLNFWEDDGHTVKQLIDKNYILKINIDLDAILKKSKTFFDVYSYRFKNTEYYKFDVYEIHEIVRSENGEVKLIHHEKTSNVLDNHYVLNRNTVWNFINIGAFNIIKGNPTRANLLRILKRYDDLKKSYKDVRKSENIEIVYHVQYFMNSNDEDVYFGLKNEIKQLSSLSKKHYVIKPHIILNDKVVTQCSSICIERNNTTCGVNMLSRTDCMFECLHIVRTKYNEYYERVLKMYVDLINSTTKVNTLIMSTTENSVNYFKEEYADFVKYYDITEVKSKNPNSGNQIVTTIMVKKK